MDRSFGGFFINGGGGGSPKPPTTNQLAAGDFILPDNTTGPVTYLLPTAPENLAMIQWIEGVVSFATNKLVFQNTDKPIMGLNEPLEITTAGSGGKLVYFQVLGYWKLYLNSQAGKTASGNAVNNVVNRLTITSPTAEQVGVPVNFSLTSTNFGTTPSLADSLDHYEWQVATDIAFSNLLWSGTSTSASVAPIATIPAGTRVYTRVRGVGSVYGAGEWSAIVTFVVASIVGPTNVTISGTMLASGGVTHKFSVQSTAWNGNGTHVSSQVQILTTGGTVVYDSAELVGAIVTHTPFDNGFRPTNLTDYVARVRYKLSTGQWTDYTSSPLRTGNGAFTTINTTFQTSRYSDYVYNALTSWYTVGGSNDPYGSPAPYYICYADNGTGGDAQWECDPGNPTANAPGNYNPAEMGAPTISAPYPRTVVTTQKVSSIRYDYNTSRSTQSWTES